MVLAVSITLVASSCSWFSDEASTGQLDEAPKDAVPLGVVTSQGGEFRTDTLVIVVPVGAVAENDEAEISVAPAPSPTGGSLEVFGEVVEINHTEPIEAPVEVRWDVSSLTPSEQSGIVLARWNAELGVWGTDPTTLSVDYAVVDTELVAQIDQWSLWTWSADSGIDEVSQSLGEVSGTRVEDPTCSGDILPSWISNTIDPDSDTRAAALRACFEPDSDDVVTVRLANNRPFTQRLKRTDSNEPLAWTWPGDADFGVSGSLFDAARTVFDSDSTYLLPSLHEVAVGIERPDTPGEKFIRYEADVDGITLLIDLSNYALGQIDAGAFDSRVVNAFAQALYTCAGKDLLQTGDRDVTAVALSALLALTECAELIVKRDNPFGELYEEIALREVNEGSGVSRAAFEKSNRFAVKAARAFKILEIGKIAFYLTDQFSNALVGNIGFGISGRGRSGQANAWTPTCVDTTQDREAWSRAWVNQDIFQTPPTRNFDEYPEFEQILTDASEPLTSCSDEHVAAVRNEILATGFGTPQAAEIAQRVLNNLTNAAAGDCPPPETILNDLSLDPALAQVEVCASGWAYVDGGGLGDAQFIARQTDTGWTGEIYFPTSLCRGDVTAMGAPETVVNKVGWPCENSTRSYVEFPGGSFFTVPPLGDDNTVAGTGCGLDEVYENGLPDGWWYGTPVWNSFTATSFQFELSCARYGQPATDEVQRCVDSESANGEQYEDAYGICTAYFDPLTGSMLPTISPHPPVAVSVDWSQTTHVLFDETGYCFDSFVEGDLTAAGGGAPAWVRVAGGRTTAVYQVCTFG